MGSVEILRDAGSFRYIGPQGLDAWFRSGQAHNTVVVDGNDPIQRLARFLWDAPQRSRLVAAGRSEDRRLAWARAEQRGYERRASRARHTRTVIRFDGDLVVVDVIQSRNETVSALASWHLGASCRPGHPALSAGGMVIPVECVPYPAFDIWSWGSVSPVVEISESLCSSHYTTCELRPAIRVEAAGRAPIVLVTMFAHHRVDWQRAAAPTGVSLVSSGGRVRLEISATGDVEGLPPASAGSSVP